MKPYLISLTIGLGVGLLYSILGVRSPAPPAVALVGLLGMLVGEHAGSAAIRWIGDAHSRALASSAPIAGDRP